MDIENFCQAQAAVNFDDYSGKSGSGWSVGRVRPFVRALRGSAVDSEQW